ncbi:MAG: TonB-dependent receptor [Prevotella sp.]|nr:TonB-dependent receptor [Prevotella sp.]
MNKAILALILSPVSMTAYAGSPLLPRNITRAGMGPDSSIVMQDVTVLGNRQKDFQMKTSVNAVSIDKQFLQTNFSGSLMQTLSGIPGVKAMSIGSGQSKPTIRGLGFNRMVVTQDGIKHEGQQWGDDHGLEIDQFAVDHIEVVKGPAALLYGSDAIGGVINLYGNYIPTKKLQGSASLFSRTNNESLGLSARLEGTGEHLYWKANATLIDYADYKVPTDKIQYYSYDINLKDKRLRNTAGLERDGSVTLGYKGYNFHTELKLSDAYSKSGFFANAHGLEVRLSDIDYDHSRRDIDLPYQSVNHLKVMSHTVYQQGGLALEADFAYQNNHRKELSEPVSHGYMPTPPGSLEREFRKNTYTGNLQMRLALGSQHTLSAGASAEYQHNRRSGWGFIIPDFETMSFGAYAFDRYTLTKDLILNAGLRYDHVRTSIHSYHDWFKTPTSETDSVFKERSSDLRRSFNSLTWSAGINYATGNWLLKANIGKSFRVPIPKELGTDGVNYHIFRYEKGNPDLDPEESYQLDAGIHWGNGRFTVQLDPYLNYFPNYIYMNPTPNYYEGLQWYHYTQSRVIRYGFELQAEWQFLPFLSAGIKGEYLHAEQLSGEKKGFSLPFSTPWSADGTLRYIFCRHQPGNEGFIAINLHLTGRQDDIVPPESPTPGYCTLNLTAGKDFAFGDKRLRLSLNAENLLNRRYYDHTSFYRLIDVPEPGRNVALMIGFDF